MKKGQSERGLVGGGVEAESQGEKEDKRVGGKEG